MKMSHIGLTIRAAAAEPPERPPLAHIATPHTTISPATTTPPTHTEGLLASSLVTSFPPFSSSFAAPCGTKSSGSGGGFVPIPRTGSSLSPLV